MNSVFLRPKPPLAGTFFTLYQPVAGNIERLDMGIVRGFDNPVDIVACVVVVVKGELRSSVYWTGKCL